MNKISKIVWLLAVLLMSTTVSFAADEMLQNDNWYEGPPPDPFNVQAWADYWDTEYLGNQLAVVLDTNAANYPVNIEEVDFLCGNDADGNLAMFNIRIYKVGPDGKPGDLIWVSPSPVGWTTYQATSSVYLVCDFASLWPSEDLPTINEGPFILSIEYVGFSGQTDLCADNSTQVPGANLVYYNPADHGGTPNGWKWEFAENAGELSGKSLDHNFIIRAHVNHNVPAVYTVPSMGFSGILLLGAFFSFLFGWRRFK